MRNTVLQNIFEYKISEIEKQTENYFILLTTTNFTCWKYKKH